MIRLGDVNDNQVLPMTISGELTKSDYEQVLPELEKLLNTYDCLRFFIKLEDFSGFELGAIWEDLKFDFRHKNQFGKTAVVGDNKWEEWGTKISKLFFTATVRFFDKQEEAEAWNWINKE